MLTGSKLIDPCFVVKPITGGSHQSTINTMAITTFTEPPYALPLADLGELFPSEGRLPPVASAKRLDQWKMEEDDAPILEFLYRVHRPRRHLELGTWQGWGASLCLESCDATVWTINLADGELRADGTWAYGHRVVGSLQAPYGTVPTICGTDELGPRIYHHTDAGGYIGRIYRERGLGHRVCQVYCDSRMWDTSNYPAGFFDSVLVDGGHQPDVVMNDTRKSLPLLRSGGLIIWHDFCPLPEIRSQFESVKGVTDGVERLLPELQEQLEHYCWISPSWILVGIKK